VGIEKRKLLWILTIGLILRLGLLAFFWDKPPAIVDETHYNMIAIHLYNHDEFSLIQGKSTAIRPPLYPALLNGIYFFSNGINQNAVRVVQITLGLLSIYMIYELGLRVIDEKTGLLAALLFAVYPSFLFFTNLILTEVLFTLLLIFFVYYFIALFQANASPAAPCTGRSALCAILSGIFLGLSALTRSVMYPFVLPGILFLLIFFHGSITKKILISTVFALSFATVMAPWALRNYRLLGQFVPVDTMGGLNLYMGNYEHTPTDRPWAAVDLTGEKAWHYGHATELSGKTEAQKQDWAMEQAKKFMRKNAWLTVKRMVVKAVSLWGLERTVIAGFVKGTWPVENRFAVAVAVSVLILGAWCIVALSSLFGLVLNIGIRRPETIFVALFLSFFTAVHAVVFGHPRYHLPLMPLLALFSAWSFLNFRVVWGKRRTPQFVVAALGVLILAASWVREIVLIKAGGAIGAG
jgi:4-amino-4-deoxy-L-arabinose transferase-like glycosyltransferase